MRAIILNTAATDNQGVRHEAGEELKVGDDKGEIALDRAKRLIGRDLAVEAGAQSKAKAGD